MNTREPNPGAPHPPSLSPRALALVGTAAFIVAVALFAGFAANLSSGTPLVLLDAKAAAWLHARTMPWLTALLLAVTHAHSTLAIVGYSMAFGLWLARKREWYWLLTLAGAVGGGLVLNAGLKQVYERARPQFAEPILTLATYSFPSGHTAGAVVFYGVLAAFLVSRVYDPRRRAACVAGAMVAVALVAFSRVYLGVHYLSDVAAAVCSSTAWLVLCLSAGHALVRRRCAQAQSSSMARNPPPTRTG
jgi:undecaprenyl-diphosphatase